MEQRQLSVEGISVDFPFDPYPEQIDFMRQLIKCLKSSNEGNSATNAILESPTGTGKTLCLLCASLSWLRLKKLEHREQLMSNRDAVPNSILRDDMLINSSEKPKIIYTSRTHTQLSQVVREFKRTTYNRDLRMSIQASRDHLCIHPEVSSPHIAAAVRPSLCSSKISKYACSFYNNVAKAMKDASLLAQNDVQSTNMDIEDLLKFGRKTRSCPFFVSRDLHSTADLVLMPYQYLLDQHTRTTNKIELKNAVVIFDEAHNLGSVCEEAMSFVISCYDVQTCVSDIDKTIAETVKANEGSTEASGLELKDIPSVVNAEVSVGDLLALKKCFVALVAQMQTKSVGSLHPGSLVYTMLENSSIKADNVKALTEKIKMLADAFMNPESECVVRSLDHGRSFKSAFTMLKRLYQGGGALDEYRVYFDAAAAKRKPADGWGSDDLPRLDGTDIVLKYWCLSADPAIAALLSLGVRNIILTSGTLSPIEGLKKELPSARFPITLTNPHIVRDEQVLVRSISRGKTATGRDAALARLNSGYHMRSSPVYKATLGRAIADLLQVIPAGVLVFFPSYATLRECEDLWKTSGHWEAMGRIKPVFIEPKNGLNFKDILDDYTKNVRSGQGACLFGVCRGKLSEGMDFGDAQGRAVIITGIPYPPVKDPRIEAKRKYLDERNRKSGNGYNGTTWYNQEATRAVNQAIGRVIRHKDDYGAIFLLDERFQSRRNELPTWLADRFRAVDMFDETLRRTLVDFFRVNVCRDAGRLSTNADACRALAAPTIELGGGALAYGMGPTGCGRRASLSRCSSTTVDEDASILAAYATVQAKRCKYDDPTFDVRQQQSLFATVVENSNATTENCRTTPDRTSPDRTTPDRTTDRSDSSRVSPKWSLKRGSSALDHCPEVLESTRLDSVETSPKRLLNCTASVTHPSSRKHLLDKFSCRSTARSAFRFSSKMVCDAKNSDDSGFTEPMETDKIDFSLVDRVPLNHTTSNSSTMLPLACTSNRQTASFNASSRPRKFKLKSNDVQNGHVLSKEELCSLFCKQIEKALSNESKLRVRTALKDYLKSKASEGDQTKGIGHLTSILFDQFGSTPQTHAILRNAFGFILESDRQTFTDFCLNATGLKPTHFTEN